MNRRELLSAAIAAPFLTIPDFKFKESQEVVPHTIYCGPRGSGKTYSLAQDIVKRSLEGNGNLLVVTSPTFRQTQLVAVECGKLIKDISSIPSDNHCPWHYVYYDVDSVEFPPYWPNQVYFWPLAKVKRIDISGINHTLFVDEARYLGNGMLTELINAPNIQHYTITMDNERLPGLLTTNYSKDGTFKFYGKFPINFV